MRKIILDVTLALAATALIAPPSMAGVPAPSGLKAPAHAASDAPVPGTWSCPGGSRFLSHAAYIPAAGGGTVRCGRFLPTDTMMTIRRWDRT